MKCFLFLALILVSYAAAVPAQPTLENGDVLVTTYSDDEAIGRILVFSRSGTFKGNLITVANRGFGDLFFRDGLVYAAAGAGIETINASGQAVPFAAAQPAGQSFRHISPGPNGGVIGVGAALNQFASDGSLIRARVGDPLTIGAGIDLASDGCTLFQNRFGRLARWDACLDSSVTVFGSYVAPGGRAMRILPDGTFLLSLDGGPPFVVHLNSTGDLIREYPLGASLALDIDGTSYWTGVACHLRRIDIATGATLTISEDLPGCTGTEYIAVVGEPRPALAAPAVGAEPIPTASASILALLAVAIAVIAVAKLRLG
jgi:hypothetical protein